MAGLLVAYSYSGMALVGLCVGPGWALGGQELSYDWGIGGLCVSNAWATEELCVTVCVGYGQAIGELG